MLHQLLWGIISTVLLAVLIAALYFRLRGTDIITAGYFRYDFTVVVGFVLLLNTLYLIIGLVQHRQFQFKMRIPNKVKPKDDASPYENIVAIYPVERGFVAILKSGESIIWTKTIEQSLHELPESEYFLINRSDIVHRELIAGYQPSDSRRLKLILKEPLASGKEFIVSQRKVVEFKRWFKNGFSK
ncbi:LytTR family transcriptional regulator DNA-binding domain-containing protein [Pedobacter sp. UBA5917]|uniref:LytTR family transcriptional regulator DNA-binding domain-containing protein n=1 Tax=Pedobacter sp. UBA5917 TaxID=1947061 RepID=UPI0025CF3A43|nr:LytTR family transcriptional regulator DNA-binding domain-containing protein [Pedobacter sp. UBA5917]